LNSPLTNAQNLSTQILIFDFTQDTGYKQNVHHQVCNARLART